MHYVFKYIYEWSFESFHFAWVFKDQGVNTLGDSLQSMTNEILSMNTTASLTQNPEVCSTPSPQGSLWKWTPVSHNGNSLRYSVLASFSSPSIISHSPADASWDHLPKKEFALRSWSWQCFWGNPAAVGWIVAPEKIRPYPNSCNLWIWPYLEK